MITDVQIEQWLDARGIVEPKIRNMTRQGLFQLRDQGKLDLQTVGLKHRTTIHKFDHEHSDVPVLFETVISDNGKISVTHPPKEEETTL